MKSRREWTLVCGIFLLLFIGLGTYKVRTWVLGYGDSTFLVDLSRRIAETGRPESQVSASIADCFARLLGKSAAEVCPMPLKAPNPPLFNYFKWHPYLILYVLAPLHWILSPTVVLSLVTVASFLGLIWAVYWVARKEEQTVISSIASSLFIASLPVWSYGIQGQLYVDRWVIGLGFWFLIWLHYFRHKILTGLLLSAAIISLSDRYGFMVGALICGYFILFPKAFRYPKDLLWLGVGFFGVICTYLMINFYIEYLITSSFLGGISLPAVVEKILHPDSNMKTFLLLNFVVAGFFAIGAPRLYLLALGLLLPNLIGSVGGAEKTGFTAHYHSMYFPVLAFAITMGISSWRTILGRFRCLVPVVLICAIILNLGLWKANGELSWTVANLKSNPLFQPWLDLRSTFDGYLATRIRDLHLLQAEIPEGAKVVSPETYMPTLLARHEVHIFPIALEDSDYLVLQAGRGPNGEMEYYGAFSFVGEEDRRAQDMCLQNRARQLGYDFDNVKIIGDGAIIPRVRK